MGDRIGQQLGNYRLVKLLGKGGFAEVYLGQHVRLVSKQAAIKILHLLDIDARKFQEEAETTEKLVHPHIVRLLDFDIKQSTPFLVLDYAPGGSLRVRHPQGSIVPLASVGEYLKEIAPALQYAHDQHILHRDIKPDNMLIGRQGELLLSDFGIAVLTRTGRTSLSSAYGIGGTPYYMAPETYRARPGKESDQYALAVVVYEWLCGSVPFSEGDFIQLGYQHSHEPVPSLREKNPAIPHQVEAVIMKALSKEPKNRFPTIQAFAEALEQAVNASQQDARVSQQPHRQPSRAPTLQSNLQAIPLPSPQPQLGSVNQQQGGGGAQNSAQQGGWNQQQQAARGLQNPTQQQAAWGAQAPAQPQQGGWNQQPTTSASPGNTNSGTSVTIPAQPWRHQIRSITPPSQPASYTLATPSGGASSYALTKQQKRLLALPLTRTMDARKSWLWTLSYAALLLLLSLLLIYLIGTYPIGSSAITSIWINTAFIVLSILLIIMSTTLCGALLGKWRGTLTSLVAYSLVFLLARLGLANLHLYGPSNYSPIVYYLYFLMFPLTALVTGWIYERRRYASFGKSWLSMLAGNAFLSMMILSFDYALEPPVSNSSSPLALTIIVGGCLLIFVVGLFALICTVLEALVHKIVTSQASSLNSL